MGAVIGVVEKIPARRQRSDAAVETAAATNPVSLSRVGPATTCTLNPET